jgi:hypothetical protein
MNRRDVTSTIWRTVVFSGAMLGASACAHKAKPPAAPATTTPDTKPTDGAQGPGSGSAASDPDEGADAAGRPRGSGDDRPVGRGFILS